MLGKSSPRRAAANTASNPETRFNDEVNVAKTTLKSDTTGVIWEVLKQPGDTIEIDEPIVIIESMKMEIPVLATQAGRVDEVLVAKGDSVAEGQTVATVSTD